MTTSTSGQTKSVGRIEKALLGLFTKNATICESQMLDEKFRLLTLTGESLRGVRWTPGAKVQVALGGWVHRTYTPLSWDAASGTTKLLVFLHGDGPAAVWGRASKVGQECTLFGPRDSLDLDTVERPALVFGDETSFGLAHALRFTSRGVDDVRLVFEVTSRMVAEGVLSQLGIANVDLIERRPDDAHLSEVERVVVDHVQSRVLKSFVLSGKAPSIRRLNKQLRSLGLSSRQIRTRAYWAPGKVGLD